MGSASVTMTGGTAVAVYGGGWAGSNSQDTVTGAASVSLSGTAEVSGGVYGGGYPVGGGTSTASSKTVTVGGGVKIGGETAKGIVINGGTASVANGVDSFTIADDLTDNASVNVQLPAGYDITSNPTIATDAVEADLAKIKLVGAGAEGKEAYFESNAIKVRAKTVVPAHTHAMSVDCSATEGEQVNFDKALTAETTSISASGNYYLTGDVTIADNCLTITGADVVVNLCLNGHTLTAGNADSNVIQVVDGATLNICDCQPDAANNTAITDPTTDGSVTVTGGLITGGKAHTASRIGSTIEVTGTGGTEHTALHLYGGTVAGNVSENGTVNVLRGSFTLHGGRLAYNTNDGGCVRIEQGGNATIAGGAIENNHSKNDSFFTGGAVVHSGASLTISGKPVIRGNTRGTEKTPGNIYLFNENSNQTITIGENFDPTGLIGVTTGKVPTQDSPVPITGANSKDYSSHFKSDNDAYVIQNGANNVVQLRAKSDDATLYELFYQVPGGHPPTPVPGFAADKLTYHVTLPYGTSATAVIDLIGNLSGNNATMQISDAHLSSGSGTGTIKVTSEDGTKTNTYTVDFTIAQPTTYTVTVGSTTNGTVSASPTSAAGAEVTLTVTPANGYELDTLIVHKTGEAGTTVTVSNSKFTMPAYNVTVSATFKKTADQTAVESAKTIIEGGAYTVAQATANSADAVKTWLATTINALSGMSDTGVTVQASNVTVSDFTAAQADTTGSGGSDGSFQFTVSLSKSGAAASTTSKDGTITKTPYTPPATTHTITFDAGGGSVSPGTAQTNGEGKLASLPTPTRSGNYSFDYWQLSDGTRVTLDTVFDGDTTITARWTYTGGSSSSGSHTTTEKHPDGSITTTVTKPDGTKTETTKAPDGTKTVVETRKDGAKTETVETPDGTRAETVTTAQGDRTYTEQRPDGTKITADAPKSGEATAKVTLPENAQATVVSFPVTDGTVVLRVLPDGAEEPVPFSLVKDGKVYVRLDGDAELKVETRAGLFDDMGGHWAEEFADFTGARALFEGTAPRNFAPEQTMTRAMLATVLYRMDGKPQVGQAAFDDVEAAAWYAPGAAWASENGIAAGSGGALDGGRAISRQELAVMLWNYAKYDGLDVSADGDGPSYSDLDEAAEWAVPALNWASGMGILQGDRNGALDPTGTATRAEAAAMLERFVVAVVQ